MRSPGIFPTIIAVAVRLSRGLQANIWILNLYLSRHVHRIRWVPQPTPVQHQSSLPPMKHHISPSSWSTRAVYGCSTCSAQLKSSAGAHTELLKLGLVQLQLRLRSSHTGFFAAGSSGWGICCPAMTSVRSHCVDAGLLLVAGDSEGVTFTSCAVCSWSVPQQ
jgi:hypothetical protein